MIVLPKHHKYSINFNWKKHSLNYISRKHFLVYNVLTRVLTKNNNNNVLIYIMINI